MLFKAVLGLTLLMISFTGCTVGKPSLSSLSEFNGITFSAEKKLTQTYTIGTSPTCNSELTVMGQCDQRFNQLQFSVDDEFTWTNITGFNSTSEGDCADNQFKLYIANICQAFGVEAESNVIKKIHIRGDKKIPQNVTRDVTVNFSKDYKQISKITILSPGAIDEGSSNVFTVNLDAPVSRPVTVQYSTTLGSALAGDFTTAPSGALTFAAGETQKTITVATSNNTTLCELNKTFSITLASPSDNATIETAQANASITDTDKPAISIVDNNSGALGEGGSTEGTSGNMKVLLSAACPNFDITFNWKTLDGLATISNSDYPAVTAATATILKGDLFAYLAVSSTIDANYEADENITVQITNPVNATLGIATGEFYIINDDSPPTLSINSPTAVTEGGGITFNVTLSATSYLPLTVNYTFAHVTTNAADFSGPPVNGTLTFAAGDITKNIFVSTFNDTISEATTQTFTYALSNPTVATLGTTITGTGSITDDEALPMISISAATATEGSNLSFSVTLDHASEASVSATYTTQDITALSLSDYSSSTATITIPSGSTVVSVPINTTNDANAEVTETMRVTLTSPVNGTLANSSAIGTITDNDLLPAPTISLSFPSAATSVVAIPKLQIGGIVAGETIRIYTDNCSSSIVATFIASGNSQFVVMPEITNPSTVTYKALRETPDQIVSACSGGYSYTFQRPVVEALYSNAANWNDYFSFTNAGADVYNQGNSACNYSETGLYGEVMGCVHGGEMRKVTLTGVNDCNNITSTETLEAFKWECKVLGGVATLVSKKLQDSNGLRDLIDSSPLGWKANQIKIYYSAQQVSQTALATNWWSNTILPLPETTDGTSNTNLTGSGTIYAAANNTRTAILTLNTNKISVVTLGTSRILRYTNGITNNNCTAGGTFTAISGAYNTTLCIGNAKNLWIEANIVGNGHATLAPMGIFAYSLSYSRIHQTTVSEFDKNNSANTAIKIQNSGNNFISNLDIYNVANGMYLISSYSNKLNNINIGNTTEGGLATEFGGLNYFQYLRLSNLGSAGTSTNPALLVNATSNNVYSHVTITNAISSNALGSLVVQNGSIFNIFSQLLVAGSPNSGIYLVGPVNNNIFTQVTSVNHTHSAVKLGSGTSISNNHFISLVAGNSQYGIQSGSTTGTGNMLVDSYFGNISTKTLDVQQNTPFLSLDKYLTFSGSSNCNAGNFGASDHTICISANTFSGGSFSSAFQGPQFIADVSNGQSGAFSNDLLSLSLNSILRFSTWARGWGKDATSMSNPAIIGASPTNIRIHDFTLEVSSPLYNRSYEMAGTPNDAINSDTTPCTSRTVSGSETLYAASFLFFRNAIEINNDEIGNNNALCEGSESCFYAPNLGAFQNDLNSVSNLSVGYCKIGSTTKIYKY